MQFELYSCGFKKNCTLLASTKVFDDPCPGTLKYLEAHYQCVSGNSIINSNIILLFISITQLVRAVLCFCSTQSTTTFFY